MKSRPRFGAFLVASVWRFQFPVWSVVCAAAAYEPATLHVEVRDAGSEKAVPCRITIVDRHGELAAVRAETNGLLAVRPGVVYTGNGQARLGLAAGDYTVFATRGFEYGLATREVSAQPGQGVAVHLTLRREVATAGWVACDTHIHTLTYSGHGDATLQERIVTLAGEGIELPIATEHNLPADYAPAARQSRLDSFFTPVIGCEVTTGVGHFNAFPMHPDSAPPDFHLRSWPALMESIRATPGVRFIVLNHPRDLHEGFRPFAATNFNGVTGESRRGWTVNFDGLEVVNSGALQSDPMQTYRDWFALLNHGDRVTAVGASDSHDVNRYIVGQGRSYVACDDADPARIDVSRACESLRTGRVLVSLGLLVQMTVNEQFGVGDLAVRLGDRIRVKVTVLHPSWLHADRVELFSNGSRIREARIDSGDQPSRSKQESSGNSQTVQWTLPRPAHDVYLVAIASGPGITAPYWPLVPPYQPTSKVWEPRIIGSTNPIWIDADGDGTFSSARAYAVRVFAQSGPAPQSLLPALATYDPAVCAQAASLCQAAGQDIRAPAFLRALDAASESVCRGFRDFAATLPSGN